MKARVLVVDDFPDMRRAVSRELGAAFTVVEAENAEHAIAILDEDQDFVAVVSDFSMGPGADGAALLDEVRRRLPEAARILVTGTPSTIREAGTCDAADIVFDKPWKRGAIVAHLVSRMKPEA
jgi:DNA-binding NtrC family response regulator